MKPTTRRHLKPLALGLAALAFVCALLTAYVQLRVTDVELVGPPSVKKPIRLPYEEEGSADARLLNFKMKLQASAWSLHRLRVLPDDCIVEVRLNGREIPLTLNKFALCAVGTGTDIDFGSALREGENDLEIDILDKGGLRRLHVARAVDEPLLLVLSSGLALALCGLAALAFFALGFHAPVAGVLGLGLLVRFAYLGYTQFGQRGHDMVDHLDFLFKLLASGKLPPSDACFECHQPPLYYLGAAAVFSGTRALGWDALGSLMLFSLFAQFALVVAAAVVFQRHLKNAAQASLATALVAFWPTSVLHSVRIGNDPLFYGLYGVTLLFVYEYWSGRDRTPLKAVLAGVATLLTKLTGLLGLVLTAGCVALKFRASRDRRAFARSHLKAVAVLAAGMALFFLLSFYRQGVSDLASLNSFDRMPKWLHVGRGWRNFLLFDPVTFFTKPFINTYEDQYGRQYFWNFLLRSSLTGEWFFGWAARPAAIALGFTLFPLLGVSLFGMWRAARDRLKLHVVTAGNLALMLASLFAYRYFYPAACNNDFRFILPVLISLAFFFVEGLKGLRALPNKAWGRAAELTCFAFLGMSLAFEVLPLFIAGWR